MFKLLKKWANKYRVRKVRPSKPARRLTVERLEARLPMAGNVAANVALGNLSLQGDLMGNEIELRDLGGGSYEVVGLNGTTVNGAASQVFNGVAGYIKADLMRGNDVFLIDEVFSAPGNLELIMGGDDDLVELLAPAGGGININGMLNILGGSGHDGVSLKGVRAGNAMLDMGEGNDEIKADQFEIGSTLGILTRAGDDLVSLNATKVFGTTRISTGLGNDTLKIGGGSEFVGQVSAFMDDGKDSFLLSDATFHDRFYFDAGMAEDSVEVSGKVRFLMPATLKMGDGNDTVVVESTAWIDNPAGMTWDGGLGFDSIFDANGNYSHPALVARLSF